ncbi:MAG: membrane dipeptidase [Chitinophagaceae bacterium]|nr:membrane dipeptidase [Chitinophagaceae bacterium]
MPVRSWQCPDDLRTIADLQKLPAMLEQRGYSGADIDGVMFGNWIRFLKNAWR